MADASSLSSSRVIGRRRHHPRKTRLGVQATIIPSKKLCNNAIPYPPFIWQRPQTKLQTNSTGASSTQIRKFTKLFSGNAASHKDHRDLYATDRLRAAGA